MTITPDNCAMVADAILDSPTASFWLKEALESAWKRDCVDAAADAELLAKILTARGVRMVQGKEGT